ncbi:MAG: Glycosyltransferase [Candidatus Amesbacteria bacterium GW2011_GWB1_47_19]|nr:MAG: Glycosyltransferase [Candidatus Amesbacteria bacterium GW2011_GWA1_44_24]KKU31387.1 MAG: Glycosyltransferase [Candidatus Amesbacteria bacterium GW2011_GWC1_46_24]KKU66961.1 MAG: Glycosyltransferase [Candidatus Amesbacteria bacterium GW2011_GWB1_47_19]OGD06419.1 MAG: hypothetical protein A2379_02150 [Candidatus Amesbacteria bacterium RIFOXYB1_FULL_47_13]HBC72822.1 hypothetical protein [Candidatus Amesbacteria bacterium]
MKSPGLSVVIPAYNEEKNIAACLTAVHTVIRQLRLSDWEIIVVNDGSRDRTGAIAAGFQKKIPRLRIVTNSPNKGYGGALKTGFSAATQDFIVFVPADNQFDFSQVRLLIAKQQATGADIVSGIRQQTRESHVRRFNRWGWNTAVRALFGYLATDIDCGFKLFRREILSRIQLHSDGALIDTELFAQARTRGFTVVEVPLTHLLRTAGHSTGADPRVIIKAFRELFTFWWQFRREIFVEQGRTVFRWEILTLAVILGGAAISRFWHISQYLTFLGDEGRDALVMHAIVTGRHFPLIGPGTSIGNMYLGPLYYYLVSPWLAFFRFSPVGPAVFVGLTGLAAITLMWWIGRQWFGRRPALFISALYTLSPTVIVYSRSSWNPNIMPFFALLTMYGIWKVWRLGYWRWLLISAISFAFVLNSHYLGLLLLFPMVIFISLSRKNLNSGKYLNYAIVILVILLSPLILFDLRHGWSNFSALYKFFSDRQTTVNLKAYKALPHIWPLWEDVNATLLTASNPLLGRWVALAVTTLTALELGLGLRLKKVSPDLVFCLVWLVTGIVGLGLYKQHVYPHYYGFLFPAPFLLLGFAVRFLMHHRLTRFPVILLLLLLLAFNLVYSPLRSSPNRQLERTASISDFIAVQSGSRPFNLALIAKSNYDASYRYFLLLNRAPFFTIHDHLSDQLFVICEPAGLPPDGCNPINHPLWEIAAFGWAKIDKEWDFPWGVRLFRLIHNPTG